MSENNAPIVGEVEPLDKPLVGEVETLPGQEDISFMKGMGAGLTAQPGSGVGHFIGAALPSGIGAAFGGPIGASLGEFARQTAGAIANPEEVAKQSGLGIGAQVAGAGFAQKAGEMAGPAIGRMVSKAGDAIEASTDWLSSRIGKGFLKASKAINAYGHLPEKAIKQEKLVAFSWDDLIDKAKAAKHDLGQEMEDVLFTAKNDTLTNIDDVVSPIDEALSEANKFPTENGTLIKRLEGIRQDTLDLLHKGASRGQMLNTQRANAIKKSLYKVTKYKGTDSDEIPLNKVKQDVARNIAKKIEEVTPEIAHLNERYGNLIALQNAATNRAVVAERSDIIGIPEYAGMGLAVSGNLGLGAAAVLGNRALKTPTGATVAMRGLSSIGKMAGADYVSSIAQKIAERLGGGVSAATIEQVIKEESPQ